MVKHDETGTLITGPHTMGVRWITLKVGLQLEARTNGKMKMTRGPSCKKIVVTHLVNDGFDVNIRTPYAKLIDLVESKIAAMKVTADAQEAATQV